MKAIWIVVADRGRARFFRALTPAAKQIEEIHDFVHPEAHLRRGDLEADRPGGFRDESYGSASGDPPTDFKHLTAEHFAAEVVDYLERARTRGRFTQLVVAAPPLFLGVLRDKLSAPLSRLVTLEINKDLTSLRPEEIRRHLPGVL